MDEKKKRLLIIAVVVACVGLGGLFLLGIIAGIAVPAWRSSVMAADEAAAIHTLNTIATEEQTYFREHGSYASLDELTQDGALDKRFAGASPIVEGYVYTLSVTPKGGGASPAFSVNADPEREEGFSATGRVHFYTDSTSGTIRRSEGRPATAADPALETQHATHSPEP